MKIFPNRMYKCSNGEVVKIWDVYLKGDDIQAAGISLSDKQPRTWNWESKHGVEPPITNSEWSFVKEI